MHLPGVVTDAAEVELVDPIELLIFLTHGNQQRSMISQLLIPGDALAGLCPGKNVIQLFLGSFYIESAIQTVVRGAAAMGLEECNPVSQGLAHILDSVDLVANNGFQLGDILGEIGLVSAHCLIRPERRQDNGGHGGISSHQLMPMQIIGGIISGAQQLDTGLADNAAGGHIRLGQDGIALLVNLHGIFAGQRLIHIEVALQLQMGPVVQRIADEVGHGLGPLLELFCQSGIAGNIMLSHTAGTHGAPFIVVTAQPDLGDGIIALVLVDLLGIDVAVVIDNGHLRSMLMIELPCGFSFEQEVSIHKGRHCNSSVKNSVIREKNLHKMYT